MTPEVAAKLKTTWVCGCCGRVNAKSSPSCSGGC